MGSPYIVIPAIVVAFVAIAAFALKFVVPWRRTRGSMEQALRVLRQIERVDGSSFTDLDRIALQAFPADTAPLLNHAWAEFRDTLHRQDVADADDDGFGSSAAASYRQTLPAEVYFTTEALVSTPMRTEFFKHFPGILTALGIVATFLGLIFGLNDFKTTGSIEQVNENVDHLVAAVSHGFYVSMSFIALAVAATIIEKVAITTQIGRVHDICTEVDRLFDAGAGEEYLSRLVNASEASADRMGKLKDAFVEDLTGLIDRQIQATVDAIDRQAASQSEAARETANIIADRVGETISTTMAPTIESMAAAINTATGDTSEQVGSVVERLLKDLNAGMQDLFGDQIREISTLMSETTKTLERTSSQFDGLVGDMKSSSADAAQELHQGVELLLGELTRSLASEQERFTAQSAQSVTAVAEQVEALAERNQAMSSAALATVAGMEQATGATVEALDAASNKMIAAAQQLQDATQRIKSDVGGISSASDSLNRASNAARDALDGVKETADSFAEASKNAKWVVTETERLASTIGKDTRVAAELVESVERSADRLKVASGDMDEYLTKVAAVLETTHREFAENVASSLSTGNAKFHEELSAATSKLGQVLQDLGEITEVMASAAASE